jgi:hypothetical protein
MPDPAVNVSLVPVGTVLPQVADIELAPDTWTDTADALAGEPLLAVPPPHPHRNPHTSAVTLIAQLLGKVMRDSDTSSTGPAAPIDGMPHVVRTDVIG